jgi:glutathione S-transferase
MTPDALKLYHSPASPNSRRVRIFLAEKGLKVPLVAVDLGKGERYSTADITALVTVDFAKALELSVPGDHAALKRWYETVSSRPSAAA